jgi:Helix-turn-helix domain/NB-ARC domain
VTGGPDAVEPPGRWLRRQREAAGLTQDDLAELTGLSVRAISDLERGRTRRPHPRSIRTLAGALGLSGAVTDTLIARYRAGGAAAVPPPPEPAAPERHPVGVTPAVAPRQLPAVVAHFTGRAEELRGLDRLAALPGNGTGGAVRISAIDGMAGVGKTALALHWAHGHADQFPDGQLYLNLRGFDPSGTPVPAATAVRRLLEALSAPDLHVPADPDAQLDLYRSLLADRRVLLLLDNASDAEQVRPLLPGAAGCLVLITTRTQLTDLIALDGAIPLTVDVLTAEEARELLARRLGPARMEAERAEAERAEAERAAAGELIELCARLPLALNIAASLAVTRPRVPLALLAGELRDTRQRLDLLSTGNGAANLRAVFSWSYRALSAPAARMFRLLGVQPGPDISTAAAASLAALDRDQARRTLGELTAAHLLTEHVPGRFSLHDLLRDYAAERAEAAARPAQCPHDSREAGRATGA